MGGPLPNLGIIFVKMVEKMLDAPLVFAKMLKARTGAKRCMLKFYKSAFDALLLTES